MTPYYQDSLVTLYHGDCREILPHLHATAVVTDPVWPDASVALAGSEDPAGLLSAMCSVLGESVQRIAIQLGCDSDPRFLSAVPDRFPFFRVAWLEMVRMSYKGRLGVTGDIGYLFGVPPMAREGQKIIPGRVTDTDSSGKQVRWHPCPRKLCHVEWLVKWWTEPADIVVDPFAGSGTTLVAANNWERKVIGIEIDGDYCEGIAQRMSSLQTRLALA